MRLLLIIILIISSFAPIYSQEFCLTTYNIFMLPKPVNRYQLQRAPYVADYILENNSDVFVLQETFNTEAIKIINDKIKNVYPYQLKDTCNSFLKTCSGLWILSKYPFLEHKFVPFKNCYSWDCFANKGVMYIEINFKNIPIQIFGTHLNATSNQHVRDLQYQEMRSVVQKYSKPKELQIICGDFNTLKDSTNAYSHMLNILNLKDYESNYYTYDAKNNNLHDEWIVGTIDYVFINDVFLNIKRRVEKPQYKWSKKRRDLSDHYSVKVSIKI